MKEEFNDDINDNDTDIDAGDLLVDSYDINSELESDFVDDDVIEQTPDFEDDEWERLREVTVTGPDGEEIPLYQGNIRENTTEEILHNEYEEAMLGVDIRDAERRKGLADKMQSGDYGFGDLGPISDTNEIKHQEAVDEGAVEITRVIHEWSRDPYTEEYKPEDKDDSEDI